MQETNKKEMARSNRVTYMYQWVESVSGMEALRQSELWIKNLLYMQDPGAIIPKGMMILKKIMKCFTGVPRIFQENLFICVEIST